MPYLAISEIIYFCASLANAYVHILNYELMRHIYYQKKEENSLPRAQFPARAPVAGFTLRIYLHKS